MAKHIHKYYKRNSLEVPPELRLWACAVSDCYHYMPKHLEHLLPGKSTVCWKCGNITAMDSRTMATEKPICEQCEGIDYEAFEAFIKSQEAHNE